MLFGSQNQYNRVLRFLPLGVVPLKKTVICTLAGNDSAVLRTPKDEFGIFVFFLHFLANFVLTYLRSESWRGYGDF